MLKFANKIIRFQLISWNFINCNIANLILIINNKIAETI